MICVLSRIHPSTWPTHPPLGTEVLGPSPDGALCPIPISVCTEPVTADPGFWGARF